jgi:hypothetical protein
MPSVSPLAIFLCVSVWALLTAAYSLSDNSRAREACRGSIRDGVGQIDKELSQAALGGCIVTEDG